MSFGFAIGDFIAVGQLAQSLYKDVYLVALEELRLLLSEMATLSQSINLLIEEVKSPTSTLIRAGESRVKMVNEMMKQANATLKDLERFAKKYDFGDREGGRAKLKRTWDKLKFAREKSSIDELRSKVQYHNGAMNLLLTSAGK